MSSLTITPLLSTENCACQPMFRSKPSARISSVVMSPVEFFCMRSTASVRRGGRVGNPVTGAEEGGATERAVTIEDSCTTTRRRLPVRVVDITVEARELWKEKEPENQPTVSGVTFSSSSDQSSQFEETHEKAFVKMSSKSQKINDVSPVALVNKSAEMPTGKTFHNCSSPSFLPCLVFFLSSSPQIKVSPILRRTLILKINGAKKPT